MITCPITNKESITTTVIINIDKYIKIAYTIFRKRISFAPMVFTQTLSPLILHIAILVDKRL